MLEFLSKYQCGLRKGYSTQHCLLAMFEKWKSEVDKGNHLVHYWQICLRHLTVFLINFCLQNFIVYVFSIAALRVIHSYLTNRKQRTKVNLPYSPWEEMLSGVPQRSFPAPLLFSIFLCDLFYIMNETDLASYADDNMPYRTVRTTDGVILSLEPDSMMSFQWFCDNQMKSNISKCHLLLNKKDEVTTRI